MKLKWQQAPVKTQWGDEMVVASVAIDKDHTLDLYCEREQIHKVEIMFAQRTWVGLTTEEVQHIGATYTDEPWGGDGWSVDFATAIADKLKEKNT